VCFNSRQIYMKKKKYFITQNRTTLINSYFGLMCVKILITLLFLFNFEPNI